MLELRSCHCGCRPASGRGFTLIEMLTVLTVAAILLGIGVPGLRSLLASQQVASAAHGLLAAINLTRSEAIRRGTRVDLVPADGNDWGSGWIVFVDDNDNQKRDRGEQLVFSHSAVADGIGITSNMPGQYLAYQGSGRTRTNASSQSPMFGTFTISLGEHTRMVTINMLGRARICNPAGKVNSC